MNVAYRFPVAPLIAAICFWAEPAAASRLISQTVEGTTRVCIYEGGGRNRLPGTRPALSLTVGVGEPCPARYPDTDRSLTPVPDNARLISRREIGNYTVCTYFFRGRNYERQQRRGALCPLTQRPETSEDEDFSATRPRYETSSPR